MRKSYESPVGLGRELLAEILVAFEGRQFEQRRQLLSVLQAFNDRIDELRPLLDKYPLDVFSCEDGSVALDWQTPEIILNIDIEDDPEESGWTLSSTRKAGLFSEGETFNTEDGITSALNAAFDKILLYQSVLL